MKYYMHCFGNGKAHGNLSSSDQNGQLYLNTRILPYHQDWSKRGLISEVKPESFFQKTKRIPRYLIANMDLFKFTIGR